MRARLGLGVCLNCIVCIVAYCGGKRIRESFAVWVGGIFSGSLIGAVGGDF